MKENKTIQIANSPKYKELVQKRSRFGWGLTAAMMFVYYGYIYLVAFNKEFLAKPIGNGVTTLSIPFGIGVIIFTIIVTGVYVRRANKEFDQLTTEIVKENA